MFQRPSTPNALVRNGKPNAAPRAAKLWLALWTATGVLTVALMLYPIRSGSVRFAIVVGVLSLWCGAMWFARRNKTLRFAAWTLTAGVLLCLLAPGRAEDPTALRREYVRSLRRYEGTPYVWGGETRRGIDCSGLMRCGLMDANLKRGFSTANPALLRAAFSLWWHDASAKALGDGHRILTRFVITARSLNRLDYSKIAPGDIAVSAPGGAHVLAYIGGQTWIEADPGPQYQVLKVRVPTRNAWFNRPMRVMRWRQLETEHSESGSATNGDTQ